MTTQKIYLTTRLLDEPGKIGPFFFKEFMKICLLLLCIAWLVVMSSYIVSVPGILIFIAPASALLVIGLLRWSLKEYIISPWYLELWIFRKFIRPTKLSPKVETFPSQIVWFNNASQKLNKDGR